MSKHSMLPTADGRLYAAANNVADWLRYAATPVFAAMAIFTNIQDDTGRMADMPGMAAATTSPLAGMATMYALMGAFHLVPWLRLLGGRGIGFRQS